MTDKPDEKPIALGFLTLLETNSHDGFLGAILIADKRGVPREFRCTYPVKPTALQRILIGASIESHVGVELCGVPLMQSIQCRPDLILVDRECLLDVRSSCACPVLFIRKAGEAMAIDTPGSTAATAQKERLESPTGKFQPIIFAPHPSFSSDSKSAKDLLSDPTVVVDPLEPFGRIAKAMEVLGKQDQKFQ
jgi:hypothetical protein